MPADSPEADRIRPPPPELLLKIWGISDQELFFRSSEKQTSSMLRCLAAAGFDPSAGGIRFLDFGCGVGIVLIGLRNHANFELFGCDLQSNLIEWCSGNLNAQCYKNDLEPPLIYADSSLDVVNAISVFTHLNLELQFKWAWELYRVLKPGGYLHLTTHGPAYFGLFAHVAKTRKITNLEFHWLGDDSYFLELEQPIVAENYVPKTGAEAQGQLEVAVAHNESAIRTIFRPFILRKLWAEGAIESGHDVYVMQKPASGHASLLSPFESIESLDGEAVVISADLPPGPADKVRILRLFATASMPGTFVTEVSVHVNATSREGVFCDEQRRLSRGTRFFGDTQWSVVDIRIPAAVQGPVRFTLKSSASCPSYLEQIRWIAPHVC